MIVDEKLPGTDRFPDKREAWSRKGILEAVNEILAESNTLFDDMRKKLNDYPDMRHMLYELLYEGKSFPYNLYDESLDIAKMFGYIGRYNGQVVVGNRIFETWLYNLFVSEERTQSAIYTEDSRERTQFIRNGRLDMKRVPERV